MDGAVQYDQTIVSGNTGVAPDKKACRYEQDKQQINE